MGEYLVLLLIGWWCSGCSFKGEEEEEEEGEGGNSWVCWFEVESLLRFVYS